MSEGYVAGWLGQALRVSADELPTPVKGFSHIVSVLSVNEFFHAAVAIFPSMLPGCKSCRQMSFFVGSLQTYLNRDWVAPARGRFAL